MANVSINVAVFGENDDTSLTYVIQCTDAEYSHINDTINSFNGDGTHIEATGLMARILQIETEVLGEGYCGEWFTLENGSLCLVLDCEVMPNVSSLDALSEDYQVTVEFDR